MKIIKSQLRLIVKKFPFFFSSRSKFFSFLLFKINKNKFNEYRQFQIQQHDKIKSNFLLHVRINNQKWFFLFFSLNKMKFFIKKILFSFVLRNFNGTIFSIQTRKKIINSKKTKTKNLKRLTKFITSIRKLKKDSKEIEREKEFLEKLMKF